MLTLIMRLVGVGWYVALSITGCSLLGRWLDVYFGTKPVLTFIGLALGLALAVTGMLKMLRAILVHSYKPASGAEPNQTSKRT